MKKISYFIVSMVCAFLLPSCEQESHDSGPITKLPQYEGIHMIRMSPPTYLNYVVAEKVEREGSYVYKMKWQGDACQELFLGSSPYIALPKGWYAIDWKWGPLIDPTKNYIIDVRWEEVEDRLQEWTSSQAKMICYNAIDYSTWSGMTYEGIDKYLNIAPPTEMSLQFPTISADYLKADWMGKYHSFEDMDASQIEDYKKLVAYQDSLQEIYIERLSQIILMDSYYDDNYKTIAGVWHNYDETNYIELIFDEHTDIFVYTEGPADGKTGELLQVYGTYVQRHDSIEFNFPEPIDTSYCSYYELSSNKLKLVIEKVPCRGSFEQITFDKYNQ